MIDDWSGDEPEPDTYNELDDKTAFYIFCAYDAASKGGTIRIPKGQLYVWQDMLESLEPLIRTHETARLLYYKTPFSEFTIGRLIKVPPLWLPEAFEPWDVTALCGHSAKATTRYSVKHPPKVCWKCKPGHLEQKLFEAPEVPMSWVEYHARFRRPDWPLIRRRKLHEHPFCAVCHEIDGLDVHHNTYRRFGHERLEDLTVLCRPCHEKFHGEGHRPPRREAR